MERAEAMFATLLTRDLTLACRRRSDALLPLSFFAVGVTLFPLAGDPDPRWLRQCAPAALWVNALLATLLGAAGLFTHDTADGTLDQLLLGGRRNAWAIAVAKAASHWCLTGLPLLIAAPVAGLALGMPTAALGTLTAGVLLGTPVLSLLGTTAAALTVGLPRAGLLVVVLVLPLAAPVLVLATASLAAVEAGLSPQPHLMLLAALTLFTAVTAPWAAGAALQGAVQ